MLHLEGDAVGPGSLWAAQAAPGDRLVMMAPRRGFPFGGIEFAPGPGAELLMVADETAVPAVCAVLEQLPADGDRRRLHGGARRPATSSTYAAPTASR